MRRVLLALGVFACAAPLHFAEGQSLHAIAGTLSADDPPARSALIMRGLSIASNGSSRCVGTR
jgi:hypothetical protein